MGRKRWAWGKEQLTLNASTYTGFIWFMPRRRGTMSSRGFQAGLKAEVPLLWFEAVRESEMLSSAVSTLKGRTQHIFSRNKRQESWVNKKYLALEDNTKVKLTGTSYAPYLAQKAPAPATRAQLALLPIKILGHSFSFMIFLLALEHLLSSIFWAHGENLISQQACKSFDRDFVFGFF